MGLFTEFVKKIIVDEMNKEGFNVEQNSDVKETEQPNVDEKVETEQPNVDAEVEKDDNLVKFEDILSEKLLKMGKDDVTKTLGRAIYEAQAQALSLRENENSDPDKAFARVMGLV